MPGVVAFIFQALLLYLFWSSKKEYLFFALILVIEANPGGLFISSDIQNSFSLWPSSPFGALFFWLILLPLAYLKVKNRPTTHKFFLNDIIVILVTYFVILLLIFGVYKWTAVIKLSLPWLLLLIFPRMFRTMEDYAAFFNLIMAFVPIVILMQIYSIVFGGTVSNIFGGNSSQYIDYHSIEETDQALRPIDGIYIPFVALIGCSLFATMKKKYFTTVYLNIIAGLSIVSIFLTATRSWMLAGSFVLFVFILLTSKNPVKILGRWLIPGMIVFILFNSVPFLQKQARLALVRYETIQYLAKGDKTAGGTLKRLDVRGPRVMKMFYQSPIVGWGYGNIAKRYRDGHVGHQNLLMTTGLIGYSLWFLLWLLFVFRLFKRAKSLSKDHPCKKVIFMLICIFLSIHIINISAQWFDFLLSFCSGFVICLVFSFSDFVYRQSANNPATKTV